MIELKQDRNDSAHPSKMLVIGVGNAGVNIVDRMAMQSAGMEKIIAANTDSHSLMSSIAHEKILLGNAVTRGLGAGGDPELGAKAVEENMEELRGHMEGHSIIVVCAGLGGGTGCGAAPLIASAARELGAFVITLATLPFSFEGRRRAAQSEEALVQLEEKSNALFCFENDRMSEITQPGAGLEETFEASDLTMGRCMEAIHRMVDLPGLMRLSLGDIASLLSGRNPRCLFGFGESDAENRAFDAIGKAMKCPLMVRRKLLNQSRTVVVHIAGADPTLAEITVIMREAQKYIDAGARLHLGVGIAHNAGRTLSVSILGCLSEAAPSSSSSRNAPAADQPETGAAAGDNEESQRAATRPAARVPQNAVDGQEEAGKKTPTRPKQEFLQFDSVNRGRFEKSEPTIVEGEDLDIPTFLRMKIKVK